MKPRNTLEETRASGQMRKTFFVFCLQARLLDGPDKDVGTGYDIFEGEALQRLAANVSNAALQTHVFLTDNLSNKASAVCLTYRNGPPQIVVNARFHFDAEELLHTLAEEFVHVQQVMDGVDYQEQRRLFAYADRPYEIQAKQIATGVLGYEPEKCEAILWRDEPLTGLYDVRS